MPTFIGNITELKRYIGPRLRNQVQLFTKAHKAEVSACEHCGQTSGLEAAHVTGRDRNQIIDILIPTESSEQQVEVDLERFEVMFRKEHEPIEEAFLILCRQCHAVYDSPSARIQVTDTHRVRTATDVGIDHPIGMLPITLDPPQSTVFRRLLLEHGIAEISIYYSDNRIERRPWRVNKLSMGSNVMGNLRSRPDFRQGAWQRLGIVKVDVRILDQ